MIVGMKSSDRSGSVEIVLSIADTRVHVDVNGAVIELNKVCNVDGGGGHASRLGTRFERKEGK